jgi:hypothetical protein
MDCVVKSWIVATITDDLGEIIRAQGSTARHAWLAVESQFLGNREARSIQLETRFLNFVQGDLSVTEYCRQLKKMADDLTALGEVITDRTLVLNVIRGLNERFAHVGTLLRRAKPFPTFLETLETSSSRNSPWDIARRPLPLPSPPPPLPPRHRHLLQVLEALEGAPKPRTAAAASAVAAAKDKAAAALQDRAIALLVVPHSNSTLLASSSRLGKGALGPASTIPGLAPSRCGQEVLVRHWHPSRCPLISRRSIRLSSRRSTRYSSRPCLLSNSSRRLLLTSNPLVSGLLRGFTTL